MKNNLFVISLLFGYSMSYGYICGYIFEPLPSKN